MANEVSRRRFITTASLVGGALALTAPGTAQARELPHSAPVTAARNLELWLLSTSPR
jgi:hypothetical protein